MHVVIASRIFTPEPSAASFVLQALADRLAAEGHEVTVLTTKAPASLTPAPTSARVRVRRAPVIRDASGYVRGYVPYMSFDLPLAFRLLFSRRADVYVVEPPPTTGAVVRAVLAVLRRPYVYDAADIWSDAAQLTGAPPFVIRILRAVELFALRGARAAVTISDGVIGRMRELGVATPTSVVGFGADTEIFHYQDAAPADRPPYFVYAGSYSEWHGAGVLIDAFAQFSRTHPGFELIFIGNGAERPVLDRRSRELALESVSFLDPVPPETLLPILSNAVASIATQKPTGDYGYAFASKVYSSIASGCPVIFCGPGPTGDFIVAAESSQRTGIAVQYEADLLASALVEMADNPLLPSDRKALAQWAAQNHSMDAVAARLAAVVTASAAR